MISFSVLYQMNLQFVSLMLHDTWRTLYPCERGYTFFSPLHNQCLRIDYLLLTQADLSYLHSATIESMVLSDHHLITLTLLYPNRVTSPKIWRMDASLLTDPVHLNSLRKQIDNLFCQNDTPEVRITLVPFFIV